MNRRLISKACWHGGRFLLDIRAPEEFVARQFVIYDEVGQRGYLLPHILRERRFPAVNADGDVGPVFESRNR
jgi:hypothetical protein